MPLVVGDLVGVGGLWVKNMVERCFNEEEARIILSMSISKFGCPDQIMWHYTRNGMYSVKSGYKVAQDMNSNGELGRKGVGQSSGDHVKDLIWGAIWQLKVPPKLSHFIGKGCKNILAVRSNLQRRGIQLEIVCPHCGDDMETQVHLFFKCSFARVFWFGSPLQLDVVSVEGEDFLACWNWLLKKYGVAEEGDRLMRWVVCGLWRIWKCRNSMVFEQTLVEPNVALELLQKHWGEIERCEQSQVRPARSSRLGEGEEVPVRWVKPPFRTIKLNCDGAWHKETRRGGFGWVAQDFAGIFKGAGGMGNVCCDSDSDGGSGGGASSFGGMCGEGLWVCSN
ncbi:uncharacterized protein LOC126617057 [Malus sylvestris]|uniref:uncharacterized protein LOC126617057 n=1 Tax=Malus sylvestris TaxID=3752 RepID=UPI0021ACF104|nr:uncharacterized protein LOC126617057 [Malus sylvestris]